MFGDDFGRFVQHVVHQDRGIGQDHALDRAVRDVALVPQRDIFERGERIRAHHAREAANLLARHGIALVRHGRAAALLAAKRLLHFANFGALQMADLERHALKRRRDNRERGKILRVAVALDHLRRNRRGGEAEPLADFLLDFRAEVRARARPRPKFCRRPSRARGFGKRSASRRFSAYQFATLRPNVIGSA